MISQAEDTIEVQESMYEAITGEVNDIITNLEKEKELKEEMYDDEIEELQKKQESQERTNELLEKEKALRDAINNKQRIYREGVGWVYEADREAVKEAQRDLDETKDSNRLDDLEKAKDAEIEALDEQIEAWNDYLEMLETQYSSYERIERQKYLLELTGAQDEQQLHEYIMNDMESFTKYATQQQQSFLEDSIKAYDSFNSGFSSFLDDYEENQLRLFDLQGEAKELLSDEAYMKALTDNGQTITEVLESALNTPISETYKTLYDSLTGAKYQVSSHADSDEISQASAVASIAALEKNGDKIAVTDNKGNTYSSLADFQAAQAKDSTLSIANYSENANTKEYSNAMAAASTASLTGMDLYDTETGNANKLEGFDTTVADALANGESVFKTTDGKYLLIYSADSLTYDKDGTATLVQDGVTYKGGTASHGGTDSLSGVSTITNTTSGGKTFDQLYSSYGEKGLYYITDTGNLGYTTLGSYDSATGVVTLGNGTKVNASQIVHMGEDFSKTTETETTSSGTSYSFYTGGGTSTVGSATYSSIQKITTSGDSLLDTDDIKSGAQYQVGNRVMSGDEYKVYANAYNSAILSAKASGKSGSTAASAAQTVANGAVASYQETGSSTYTKGSTETSTIKGTSGSTETISKTTSSSGNTVYSYSGSYDNLTTKSGATIDSMLNKYDNVAVVKDSSGNIKIVGGDNSTITTKNGVTTYTTANGTKYTVVETVKKDAKVNATYAKGIENGPVTFTGLAQLDGTPAKPEYVLNNDQAFTLLRNISTEKIAYESAIDSLVNNNSNSGDTWNISSINLNEVQDVDAFFKDLMKQTQQQYSVRKKK